ncbi:MAG: GtrA family protein [Hyphomicrobiaceae bacterium]
MKSTQARFLAAGTLAALINWLVRFPLELIIPYSAALLGALLIGMTTGFVLYDRWAFPCSKRPLVHKIRDFISVNILAQMAMFVISVSMREVALLAGVPAVVSGAGAHFVGIAAGALINYLGHRNLTFSNRSSND